MSLPAGLAVDDGPTQKYPRLERECATDSSNSMLIPHQVGDGGGSSSVILANVVPGEEQIVEIAAPKARERLQVWAYNNVERVKKFTAATSEERRCRARAWLTSLTNKQLTNRMEEAFPTEGPWRVLDKVIVTEDFIRDGDGRLRSRFLFLTYHHKSWEWDLPMNSSNTVETDMAALERWAKSGMPQISLLWERAIADVQTMVKNYKIWRASFAEEICPKTVAERKKVKVHLHLVVEWPTKVRIGRWEDWKVVGVLPSNAKSDSEVLGSFVGTGECHPIQVQYVWPFGASFASGTEKIRKTK